MKPKVLLIQQVIPAYRVPVFNLLAEQLDLTVAYESGPAPKDAAFAAKLVKTFRVPRIGKVYRGGLRRLTEGYDVVINSYDTPAYAIARLGRLKRRRFGLVHWGIGVSASYSSPYDAPDADQAFYESILRESDACLFYSDYQLALYPRRTDAGGDRAFRQADAQYIAGGRFARVLQRGVYHCDHVAVCAARGRGFRSAGSFADQKE